MTAAAGKPQLLGWGGSQTPYRDGVTVFAGDEALDFPLARVVADKLARV